MEPVTQAIFTSQCVLKPAIPLNTSRCHHRDSVAQPVIGRGPPSASVGTFPVSSWRRFIRPGGQPYFLLNSESAFSIVTNSNVHDIENARQILGYLELAKRELHDQSIQVPLRCELFLQLGEDHLSCNYYFVDHVGKALFWLEDVGTELLGLPLATSSFHTDIQRERLYWTHVEFYPMHYKSDEQSKLEDDLYKIIAHGQAAGLVSRTSTFPYNPDTCKQFLKLLSRKQGQHTDGRTLCYAARLAGAITRQGLLASSDHSTCLDRLQRVSLSDAASRKSSSNLAYPQHEGSSGSYPHLLSSESFCMNRGRHWSHSTSLSLPNAVPRAGPCRDLHICLDLNPAGSDHKSAELDNTLPKTTKTGVGETQVSMVDIRSNFPADVTGYVTRSDSFPFASGAYGDIYRGKLVIRGRSIDVAIKVHKVYLQHKENLPKRIKRYRREIIVNLQLDHPNVLPLFGIIRDPSMHPDIPVMVCPWIENGALSTYLERNKNLTVAQRLILVDGVAHGLRYLHSRHVVHGDLSGSNVLVHADGSACIGDFGLSTLLTALGGPTFTTSRQNKGTVRWMAPELLYSDTVMNPTTRSDVYSFGSIMLQILTGNFPYHHLPRDEQVIFAISRGAKPDRSDQSIVTNDRWNFIEKCWSMDLGERPLSDGVVEFTSQELRMHDTRDLAKGRLLPIIKMVTD